MKRTLLILGLLLVSLNLFAVTGSVNLTWANANSDNSCPAGPGPNVIMNGKPLDQSGNFSLSSALGSLPVGAYCIYAHYNGDSSHLPSDATPFLHTVNPAQVSTTTTVTAAPDPTIQGQVVTVSGGVQ